MTETQGVMIGRAIKKFCEDFGLVILIPSVIMSIVGIITTPILMSDNIGKRYREALILALAGFLSPIVMFILLIIAHRMIGSEVVNKGIMSFFYTAAVGLHTASLVMMIKEQLPPKKHKASIMSVIYTGLTFEGLFLIMSILNLLV